jgi:formylglycine-generating enzyme required for sulfatase activity/energy-coupling factor transporter ATP-binding protein EcfA2
MGNVCSSLTGTPGLIDLLRDYENKAITPVDEDGEQKQEKWCQEAANLARDAVAVRWAHFHDGSIEFIGAGKQDLHYSRKVNLFNWDNFYDRLGGGTFFTEARERLKEQYDYILIDSRTGVSDISGICTLQMPDVLLMCFTPNTQSIEGASAVAKSVFGQWERRPDLYPGKRQIWPVLTRVDLNELNKLEIARTLTRTKFSRYLRDIPATERDTYWGKIEIPYVPYFAFEEVLAVFKDKGDEELSLLAPMQRLTSYLTDGKIERLVAPPEEERLRIIDRFEREYIQEEHDAFVIFVIYDHRDREDVIKLCEELLDRFQLNLWLDEWKLVPGTSVRTSMDKAIQASRSCVVFVGKEGTWPKTNPQLKQAMEISERKSSFRVIPVFLSTSLKRPKLPKALPEDSWINMSDFSGYNALLAVERGIKGLPLVRERVKAEKKARDDKKIPPKYKDWVKEFYSTISYDQLAKKGEVLPVQLLEVYIPLETANPFHNSEMERMSKDHDENLKEPATIDIETLLGRVNCILLRGKAGMGKTTLIKHLANTITKGSYQSSLRDYLPVIVFLKDLWLVYTEEMKKSRRKITFEPLLKAYLEKIKCPLDWAVISNFLQHNRALFMFDGLDEIPKGIRDDLVELIADFQFENKGNRFLITGRPQGIAGRPNERFGKYRCEIEYLDDQKINEFIRKWFRAVSGKATGLADIVAEDMISDIVFHEHVSVFTQNPLLLAAVCVLYLVGKRIPEQRADLYDRIVENLLWRRFHDPAKPDKVNEIREFLMLLAFEMQNKNLKTFEVGDGLDVLKKISVQRDDEQANEYQRRIHRMFDEIESNCGLFNRLSGGEIEFTHLTFQEFMAAKQIVYMDLDYNEFLENDWWAETILLYIGLLSLEMRKRSNDVVEEILKAKQEDANIKRRLWLLGSKALRDFQPSKRDDKVVSLARDKLYELIESNASIEERFEAGEIVGTLGDPRIKADNMVLVKEGKFMRGSREDDADAYDDEKPQREIYLDDFMVGKYPVTNEEFKEFLDDGGYDKKEFWTREGWRWREENEISEPAYLHDRKWNGLNFPVVGISWFEAEAYANWLSERTGHQYRLPTEAEWEKAARRTDGFKYPWGEDFDKNLCNSFKSELLRTSPVGIFPKGKSPYGCFDMVGNVWEWCSDRYDDKYYANSPDGNPRGPSDGSLRVIRGCSWHYNAKDCRSAYRNHLDPRIRNNHHGFRLLQEL